MTSLRTVLFLLLGVSFYSSLAFAQVSGPLSAFTPLGHVLLDSAGGDLNGDKRYDLVMVYRRPEEDSDDAEFEMIARPALILFGQGNGRYALAARNDSIVLCKYCGGVFGDSWEGITVKHGFFSLEFYGGSAWRWSNIITFKYDGKRKGFYLHRDAGVSYHNSEPNKMKHLVYHRKFYRKLRFEDYRDNMK